MMSSGLRFGLKSFLTTLTSRNKLDVRSFIVLRYERTAIGGGESHFKRQGQLKTHFETGLDLNSDNHFKYKVTKSSWVSMR